MLKCATAWHEIYTSTVDERNLPNQRINVSNFSYILGYSVFIGLCRIFFINSGRYLVGVIDPRCISLRGYSGVLWSPHKVVNHEWDPLGISGWWSKHMQHHVTITHYQWTPFFQRILVLDIVFIHKFQMPTAGFFAYSPVPFGRWCSKKHLSWTLRSLDAKDQSLARIFLPRKCCVSAREGSVPSLKLSVCPWKINGWKMNFPRGFLFNFGGYVSFRECDFHPTSGVFPGEIWFHSPKRKRS